jgi:flavin-dependent dehydrogenase
LKKVIIIGGGLAGLVSAIRLARGGITCTIVERKNYPFHRVCGEYISNETVPFLRRENLFPEKFQPPAIDRFQLSSVNGRSKELKLDLGGFGISRYCFDNFLCEKAIENGVEVVLQQEVSSVQFLKIENQFVVDTGQQQFIGDVVIGAFGKRSKLDAVLSRQFLQKRSPYVGVKYHIRTEHPERLISLHNFDGGYCGISNVEGGTTNLCYLIHREQVKRFGNIPDMEKAVLYRNPHLKSIFSSAKFLFEKPETINEISFETKEPVWNHILMAGDAAGMIAPLCGNGMAMAIHSGKLVSDIILEAARKGHSHHWLEHAYARQWRAQFAKRLWIGRIIQNYLFGKSWSSNMAVNIMMSSGSLARYIIRNTHGQPF